MDDLLCNEEFVGSPSVDNTGLNASSTGSAGHGEVAFARYPDEVVALGSFVEREACHSPDCGYYAVLRRDDAIFSARSNAVHWMVKVSHVYSFSPLTIALAVNYFDRYLSRLLHRSWKAWMIELLSVACLSLASKMEETEVRMLQDLQIEGLEHIFESTTIQRMELAVMKLLGWRMSSVTPFAYIESLFLELDVAPSLKPCLLSRVNELLAKTLSEIDFLQFSPSVVALAAVTCALEELVPLQADVHKISLLKALPVEEDKLDRCYRLMEELVVDPLCPLMSLSQVLENRKTSVSPFGADLFLQDAECRYTDTTGRDSRNWDESGKTENATAKSVKRKLDVFLK